MNNKTIIKFGFRILSRIMEISEGVILRGVRPRRITPSSIPIILHKIRKPNSVIVNYADIPINYIKSLNELQEKS